MEKRIAVGVGYYFNLVSNQDVKHIELEETGTYLDINGKMYPLYKGTTFEESKKVDAVLDVVGDLPIELFKKAN